MSPRGVPKPTEPDKFPCEVCGANEWKRESTARRTRLVCHRCGHRRNVPRARGSFNP